MKISVVIPNYNGRLLLEKNLPLVIKYSPGAQIIVVDDASDDDSVAFLTQKYPQVKVIKKNKNTGFSSSVNLGAKEAAGELIVLFNTDVIPRKNYLQPLLSYFKDPRNFAVGMLQESHENGRIVLRGRGEGEFKRGFLVHRRGEVDKNSTLWVSGGAGIFRKTVWDKLGGLKEIYDPFYWEDIDISYRAIKAGYRIYFEKKSIIVHEQIKGSIRTKYTPSQIKTIAYRNQFLFVWLNYGVFKLLRHILWLPVNLLNVREFEFYKGFISALVKILTSP
ncbi:hypothetical protein A3D78_06920 [Candidatus Gottesmanbacteria bacterium RIFCSPHIGHO2_02_FULL_39_14]|uniref:Glycosyltransferase 2-like domain-containing protein n=2 Tax=Candidatus Gottesmaniibacteriota TaxID=1752720 RepID=A0A1F5ZV30_9BACT|nr:MAG: hypothetical protein A2153_01870 [Candidatus Gottesmanbacteria bacterium RBG_16_38_7b]OGG16336.1 MAG: hypothetical protein A3D78_06920 [Candidatus Gottesmanbacteria bacterium RIFCSPHIGHO2_02_FULL_39_14]